MATRISSANQASNVNADVNNDDEDDLIIVNQNNLQLQDDNTSNSEASQTSDIKPPQDTQAQPSLTKTSSQDSQDNTVGQGTRVKRDTQSQEADNENHQLQDDNTSNSEASQRSDIKPPQDTQAQPSLTKTSSQDSQDNTVGQGTRVKRDTQSQEADNENHQLQVGNTSNSEAPQSSDKKVNIIIKGTAIEAGATYTIYNKNGEEIGTGTDGSTVQDKNEEKKADGEIKFEILASELDGLMVGFNNNRGHDFLLSVSPTTNTVSTLADGTRDGAEDSRAPDAEIVWNKNSNSFEIKANMSTAQIDYYSKIVGGHLTGNYASHAGTTDIDSNNAFAGKLKDGSASIAEVSELLSRVNVVRQFKISEATDALKETITNLGLIDSMSLPNPSAGADPAAMRRVVSENVNNIIKRTQAVANSVSDFQEAIENAVDFGVDPKTLMDALSEHLKSPIINTESGNEVVSFKDVPEITDKIAQLLTDFETQLEAVQLNESNTYEATEAKETQELVDMIVNSISLVLTVGETAGSTVMAVAKRLMAKNKLKNTNKFHELAQFEAKNTVMPKAIQKYDDDIAAKKKEVIRSYTAERTPSPERQKEINAEGIALANMETKRDEVWSFFLRLQKLKHDTRQPEVDELLKKLTAEELDIPTFWRTATQQQSATNDNQSLDIANLDLILNNFKALRGPITVPIPLDKSVVAFNKTSNSRTGGIEDGLTFTGNDWDGVKAVFEDLPAFQKLMKTLRPMVLRGYAERNSPSPIIDSVFSERENSDFFWSSNAGIFQVALPPSASYIEKVDQNIKRAEMLNAQLKEMGAPESTRYLVVDERFLGTFSSRQFQNHDKPVFETRIIMVDNWIFGSEDPTIRIGNNPEVYDKYFRKEQGVNSFEWTPELTRQYYRAPKTKEENIFTGPTTTAWDPTNPFPWERRAQTDDETVIQNSIDASWRVLTDSLVDLLKRVNQ